MIASLQFIVTAKSTSSDLFRLGWLALTSKLPYDQSLKSVNLNCPMDHRQRLTVRRFHFHPEQLLHSTNPQIVFTELDTTRNSRSFSPEMPSVLAQRRRPYRRVSNLASSKQRELRSALLLRQNPAGTSSWSSKSRDHLRG